MDKSRAQLGCGLIAIGRAWGKTPKIPSETEARRFLETAFLNGIRIFDTAPSYGLSEGRLGAFLKSLTKKERSEVYVLTKFGEHWNGKDNTPYTDHSEKAMRQSLDNSLTLLGRINCLQLHKTTADLLTSKTMTHILKDARKSVDCLGASISDNASGGIAANDARFDVMQLPYNALNTHLAQTVRQLQDNAKNIVVNRPFQMGNLDFTQKNVHDQAFAFVLSEIPSGTILTGTSHPEHLIDNIRSFERVKQNA